MDKKTRKKSTKQIIINTQPKVENYLIQEIGRPIEFTESIGEFICFHVAMGLTVKKICEKYNTLAKDKILHNVKIYYWLNNDKLKKFNEMFYYARELAAQGILDDIMENEGDIENLTL